VVTSGAIFLKSPDGTLVEFPAQKFDREDELQALVAEHPELLAGDVMTPGAPRRWMLISREMGVPDRADAPARWSADHLFVDQDAMPTIVEVKRSTNTEIRRKIVGQMLDYAANAVRYWPVDSLRSSFEQSCASRQRDPQSEIAELLGTEADLDLFWSQLEHNLETGSIRMVFVADEIPGELQRIVEFLNEGLDRAEVFAVAIPLHLDANGRRLLAPSLVGATEASRLSRKRSPHPGFESVLASSPEVVRVTHDRLVAWAADNGLSTRHTKANRYIEAEGITIASMQPQWGWLTVDLDLLRAAGKDREATEILEQLSRICGRNLTDRYPHVSCKVADEHWDELREVLERVVQIHRAETTSTG
jgi:hypothetical protein